MNLIKGAIAVYLALLVVLQPVLPFIEYAVFKDYIAENLCVEKEVVDSCCKGKCFLEEKVKEANTQTPASDNKPIQLKIDTSVCILLTDFYHAYTATLVSNKSFYYNVGTYYFYGKSVFHPPQHSTLFFS